MQAKVKRTDRHKHEKFIELFDFRLNTLLECGEVRIIISTVGRLPRPKGLEKYYKAQWLPIGADRYYETAVWHAMRVNNHWDCDIKRGQIGRGLFGELDRVDEKTDSEAQAIHETAVRKIIELLAKGETFGQYRLLDASLN